MDSRIKQGAGQANAPVAAAAVPPATSAQFIRLPVPVLQMMDLKVAGSVWMSL